MKLPVGIRKSKTFPKVHSSKKGRIWVEIDVVLPDGTTTEGWYDQMWGTRFYFLMFDPNGNLQRGEFKARCFCYSGDMTRWDTEQSRNVITPDLRKPA